MNNRIGKMAIIFLFLLTIGSPIVLAQNTPDNTFLNLIFAPGFHWKNTPNDLGSAEKLRKYRADISINQWEYVYNPSPSYIFNKDFFALFTESDTIYTEFSFRDDLFQSVAVRIKTANPDEISSYKAYLIAKLGQPISTSATTPEWQKETLQWEKDTHVASYRVLPELHTDNFIITISIYVKQSGGISPDKLGLNLHSIKYPFVP